MKSFPLLRTTLAGVIALGLGTGYAFPCAADDTAASKSPAATATPTSASAPTSNKDKDDDSDEPPTTLVTPSQDTADSDESDTAKTTVDANHCTQCQIQADAYRKLKAEADNDNIKKNQEVQSKLKPDEDKSAWIKVESNLRMWDIKVESLKKNLSALEAQMKQDCQGCPNVAVPTDAGATATATPTPAPSSNVKGTKKK